MTAGVEIRAVPDSLFHGCPIGRPLLILGTVTEEIRMDSASLDGTTSSAGYTGSFRAIFHASICAESAALRMAAQGSGCGDASAEQ
jgi:hypothetical protein